MLSLGSRLRQALAPVVRHYRHRSSRLRTEYFSSAPSPQNALSVFEGEWYTSLPAPLAACHAGAHAFYDDPRLVWGLSRLGDLGGRKVLELGPLEGAHTYMLEQANCSEIISVEANPRAYLKCLVMKEVLGLHRSRFLCGDFIEYLKTAPAEIHAVIASGVLYHMANPAELIGLISRVTDRLFLWTHYYDQSALVANPRVRARFTGQSELEFRGFRFPAFRYEYWGSAGLARFCGGPRPYAFWMNRENILACLRCFGFNSIETSFDAPGHPDGPAFAVVAKRE